MHEDDLVEEWECEIKCVRPDREIQTLIHGRRLVSSHLEDERGNGNRRDGHGCKHVKTAHGQVDIAAPRDRAVTVEPLLLSQRVIASDRALLKLLFLAPQRIVEKMSAEPIVVW